MGDDPAQASQRRRVDEPRPAWLSDVLAEVRASLRTEMQAEMQKLRDELASVYISSPAARQYPETPTTATCNLLVTDPDLPPIVTPLLVALAAAAPTVLDEAIADKFQTAYSHLLALRQQPPPAPTSAPAGPSRSSSSHSRAGIQQFDGRQVYVSNAGTVYDISRPPPRLPVERAMKCTGVSIAHAVLPLAQHTSETLAWGLALPRRTAPHEPMAWHTVTQPPCQITALSLQIPPPSTSPPSLPPSPALSAPLHPSSRLTEQLQSYVTSVRQLASGSTNHALTFDCLLAQSLAPSTRHQYSQQMAQFLQWLGTHPSSSTLITTAIYEQYLVVLASPPRPTTVRLETNPSREARNLH